MTAARGSDRMQANVFREVNRFGIEEIERPHAGPGEAVVRVTLTTICGTDLHIVRGEYPVAPGLVIGHEPVGVIAELGEGVTGYTVGERVLVGAITPCGHGAGYQAIGGWRMGNTLNGAQAEYVRIPFAQANLAPIPAELSDEQVVLLADIASTGFSGAESGGVRIGDAVVVYAQGPIGLCATVGARLMGASLVIGVDGDDRRLAMALRMGADVGLWPTYALGLIPYPTAAHRALMIQGFEHSFVPGGPQVARAQGAPSAARAWGRPAPCRHVRSGAGIVRPPPVRRGRRSTPRVARSPSCRSG